MYLIIALLNNTCLYTLVYKFKNKKDLGKLAFLIFFSESCGIY